MFLGYINFAIVKTTMNLTESQKNWAAFFLMMVGIMVMVAIMYQMKQSMDAAEYFRAGWQRCINATECCLIK